MFVWECIRSEGSHVGVCVDTFMFGSCCVHNSTTNNINAVSSSTVVTPSPRPSLAEALSAAPTRPTSLSTTSRPQQESQPTISSQRPSSSQRPNPHRQRPTASGLGPGRPSQKRPKPKPNGEEDNRQGSRPQGSRNSSLIVGNIDDLKSESKNPTGTGTPDKIEDSRNTLVVKLPSRVPTQPARPHRPYNQRPSTAQRPSESRPDDSKQEEGDLVVQATMHRPSLDLANEKVSQSP